MIESDSQDRTNQVEGISSAHNLVDKVILLIGNDSAVIDSLAIEFAKKGSDIALASPLLSESTAEAIRKKVEQSGSRFLLLDDNLLNNVQKVETVIENIRKELGRIDILIDLSARRFKKSNNGSGSETPPPRWRLSTAILQELTS